MKSLKNYIYEHLILEKKSLTNLSSKITDKIINIVKTNISEDNHKYKVSDEEIEDLKKISKNKNKSLYKNLDDHSKLFKFNIKHKENKYDLFLIINFTPQFTQKTNSFDYDTIDEKNIYYIVINSKGKKHFRTKLDDTLTHEIRHFFDAITGAGGSKNNTYNDKTLNKYNKFLYYISQTEQNAFFAGFKRNLKNNKGGIVDKLKTTYKKSDAKSIEEFLEKFCLNCYNFRLKKCFKDSDDCSDIKEPKDTNEKILCHNPLRFLEYKYYILNSYKNFNTFISKNPITDTEDKKRKKEILKCLEPYNNDKPIDIKNVEEIKNVYNEIIKFYNNIYKNYIKIIENEIK